MEPHSSPAARANLCSQSATYLLQPSARYQPLSTGCRISEHPTTVSRCLGSAGPERGTEAPCPELQAIGRHAGGFEPLWVNTASDFPPGCRPRLGPHSVPALGHRPWGRTFQKNWEVGLPSVVGVTSSPGPQSQAGLAPGTFTVVLHPGSFKHPVPGVCSRPCDVIGLGWNFARFC